MDIREDEIKSMEKINTLKELQQIEEQILYKIDEFCKRHTISYYLGYGTLLGAVRHQGFIPWDDDVDIIMPRPDYERFLQIARDGIGDTIEIISNRIDKEYYLPFAKAIDKRTELVETHLKTKKVIGVYVDIFPIDGLPESKAQKKVHFKQMKLHQNMLKLATYENIKGGNIVRKMLIKLLKPFFNLIPAKIIIMKIEKQAKKYSFDNSEEVGCVVWGYGEKEEMDKSFFEDIELLKFNNNYYHAPKGYKQFLERIYGDYMKLPPVEEQVNKHNLKVVWK